MWMTRRFQSGGRNLWGGARARGRSSSLVVALVAAAAALAAPPVRADVSCCAGAAGRGGVGEFAFTPDPTLRLITPENGIFRPRAVVLRSADGAERAAALPETVELIGGPRLNLTRLPFVGPVFGDAPANDAVTDGRPIGRAFARGDALVIVLRPEALGDPALGAERAEMRFLSAVGVARRLAETAAELAFEASAVVGPAPTGAPLADVFVLDDRIVVAPIGGQAGAFDLF